MCNLGEAIELKGMQKRAIEIALRMIRKGQFSLEDIAEVTDLPPTKVEELAKE